MKHVRVTRNSDEIITGNLITFQNTYEISTFLVNLLKKKDDNVSKGKAKKNKRTNLKHDIISGASNHEKSPTRNVQVIEVKLQVLQEDEMRCIGKLERRRHRRYLRQEQKPQGEMRWLHKLVGDGIRIHPRLIGDAVLIRLPMAIGRHQWLRKHPGRKVEDASMNGGIYYETV